MLLPKCPRSHTRASSFSIVVLNEHRDETTKPKSEQKSSHNRGHILFNTVLAFMVPDIFTYWLLKYYRVRFWRGEAWYRSLLPALGQCLLSLSFLTCVAGSVHTTTPREERNYYSLDRQGGGREAAPTSYPLASTVTPLSLKAIRYFLMKYIF